MIWLQKLRNHRFYIILRHASMYWHQKQPTANIIDGNVQLHILSLIPDNFQGVTEIVSDGLPKPSRVNIVCFVSLFCCFTSQVNSYGHCGTVSSPNHTFSWASLNKQLTSNRAHTFACNWQQPFMNDSAEGRRMTVEIILWSISTKVWDRAGIELATLDLQSASHL